MGGRNQSESVAGMRRNTQLDLYQEVDMSFHQGIGIKKKRIFGFVFGKVGEIGLKIDFLPEYFLPLVSSGLNAHLN